MLPELRKIIGVITGVCNTKLSQSQIEAMFTNPNPTTSRAKTNHRTARLPLPKNHSTTRNLLQKNPKPNRTKKLPPKTSLPRRAFIT